MKKSKFYIIITAVILTIATVIFFTQFYRWGSTGMVITVVDKKEESGKYYIYILNEDHSSHGRIQVSDKNLWNLIRKDEKYFAVIQSTASFHGNEPVVFKKEHKAVLDQIKYLE
ncbi:hypothetical protein ACFDTO_13455 [Microbacteriaceae bacterium 4G12]